MKVYYVFVFLLLIISCGAPKSDPIHINLEDDVSIANHLKKYRFCDGDGNCLFFRSDGTYTWNFDGHFKEAGRWRLDIMEHGMRRIIHSNSSNPDDSFLSSKSGNTEWVFYLNESGIYWYIAQDNSKMMFLPEPRGTDTINENGVLLNRFSNPSAVGQVEFIDPENPRELSTFPVYDTYNSFRNLQTGVVTGMGNPFCGSYLSLERSEWRNQNRFLGWNRTQASPSKAEINSLPNFIHEKFDNLQSAKIKKAFRVESPYRPEFYLNVYLLDYKFKHITGIDTVVCPVCHGKGTYFSGSEPCTACSFRGFYEKFVFDLQDRQCLLAVDSGYNSFVLIDLTTGKTISHENDELDYSSAISVIAQTLDTHH